MSRDGVLLSGLNGANPLGFLAALGCIRLLSQKKPQTQLAWTQHGMWRPIISSFSSEDELAETLMEQVGYLNSQEDLSQTLKKNITVTPDEFRVFATAAADSLVWSGFAAAFGSDALKDDKGRILYTKLCFITGSGHQHFLETMRQLRAQTTEAHVRQALYESMEPNERGLSMRWDPDDAKEYALQWMDPSKEGVRSSWGAYRLAIEALPMFPAAPLRRRLGTTGFVKRDVFQWPIWRDPLSMDTIRSLVAYDFEADSTQKIQEMGVEEIFRSDRVRIGEGANFKVSFRPGHPFRRK